MKRFGLWIIVVGLALTSIGSGAHGAVTLTFEAGTATAGGGGSVNVPIYLREVLTESSPSMIAPEGLFSFGISVARDNGNAAINAVTRDAFFNVSNPGSSTSATLALVNAEHSVFPDTGPVPDGNGRVFLATLNIQPGASSSQFTIADFGANTQTVTYAPNELDGLIVGSSFTVAAVPEPAGVAALAVFACVAGVRRRSGRD
jgi:hypothetical protein